MAPVEMVTESTVTTVTKREETMSREEQPTLLETAEAAEYHVTRLEAQPELPMQPEFATFEMAPIQLVAESTVTTVTQHEETTVREEQPAITESADVTEYHVPR